MPIYTFTCSYCGHEQDVIRKIIDRDILEICWRCREACYRKVSAPLGRVYGAAYSRKHNIPDRVTADLTGIPYKELPRGLKTRLGKE